MLNRSASLAMSTSILETLPGKLDIKRHTPIVLYLFHFLILFASERQLKMMVLMESLTTTLCLEFFC